MEPAFLHRSSAFSLVRKQQLSDYTNKMECSCKDIIQNGEKIELVDYLGSVQIPLFIRLVLNILFHLIKECTSSQTSISIIQDCIRNSGEVKIKISLFKLVINVIEKRLFNCEEQKYFEEISYSMIFKSHLFSTLIPLISEHSDNLQLDKLQTLYSNSISTRFSTYLPCQMFVLYGGSGETIFKNKFTENLVHILNHLSQHFSEGQNLLMRNSKYLKDSMEFRKVLDESILTIGNFQNKTYLHEQIEKSAEQIFKEQSIKRTQFVEKINLILNNKLKKEVYSFLQLYFSLLRLEFQLLGSEQMKSDIQKRDSSLDQCNYYQQSMQKILKKCPYNGHQSCSCKKCQCVRRNRQSAKLSQEKKRNAVQQVGQMQERINQLEKKNRILEQQNMFLTKMFSQIKNNPQFKSMMRGAAQRINKVINNQ